MTAQFVSLVELHERLLNQGHDFYSNDNSSIPMTRVRSTPDTIVTVAVDPDATLKPEYRERYFACFRDEEDNLVAEHVPSLALVGPLAQAAKENPSLSEFALGPVRWLLTRLAIFPTILLWPDSQYRSDNDGFIPATIRDELRRLSLRAETFTSSQQGLGAVSLDLNCLEDAAIFWEAARLVGYGSDNVYVAAETGSEVYLMHHHDKVVVSIPDQHTRWLVLEELAELSDVFDDWSGYYSKSDEEDTSSDVESA
jgi:hypothetical protein